jgi:hypothetical protein
VPRRIHHATPGATGFVATLVLTCAFAGLAVAMWGPADKVALATDASARTYPGSP